MPIWLLEGSVPHTCKVIPLSTDPSTQSCDQLPWPLQTKASTMLVSGWPHENVWNTPAMIGLTILLFASFWP